MARPVQIGTGGNYPVRNEKTLSRVVFNLADGNFAIGFGSDLSIPIISVAQSGSNDAPCQVDLGLKLPPDVTIYTTSRVTLLFD